jgi:hypothetical protein
MIDLAQTHRIQRDNKSASMALENCRNGWISGRRDASLTKNDARKTESVAKDTV